MTTQTTDERQQRQRNLHWLRQPQLWCLWPFLPLVRRRPGVEDELGLLFDAKGSTGQYGFSATVFLTNLFLVPRTLEEFLALPKEVFDTPEELFAAGWRVD